MSRFGSTLLEREARAFDARARGSTASLGVLLLGAWFPGLLELTRTKGKRGRVHRLQDDDERAKPRKVQKARGVPDPTVYRFVLPDGEEVECARWELNRRCPGINPGSLSDLVRGAIGQTRGVRCLGRVERTNG